MPPQLFAAEAFFFARPLVNINVSFDLPTPFKKTVTFRRYRNFTTQNR